MLIPFTPPLGVTVTHPRPTARRHETPDGAVSSIVQVLPSGLTSNSITVPLSVRPALRTVSLYRFPSRSITCSRRTHTADVADWSSPPAATHAARSKIKKGI